MKFVIVIIVGAVMWLGEHQSALAQGMGASGATNPHFVDCDRSGSINLALASGHRLIEFTGSCDEEIEINSDAVELIGSGTASASVNEVVADGARVFLRGFTVTGEAIFLNRGSFGIIRDVVIEEGTLALFHNSGAELRDSEITGPTTDQAVQVLRNSFIRIRQNNTITGDPAQAAITVGSDSSLIVTNSGNQITGLVNVSGASLAEIRTGNVSDLVKADLHSVIVVRPDANILGNVDLSQDSALVNDDPDAGIVTVGGSVTCADVESSIGGNIFIDGGTNCTDFKF